MGYQPPYQITPRALALVADIMRLVGRYEGLVSPKPQPKLRRTNRIRTIQGSLAIEGNTLTFEQASAVFEGKRVLGPRREILEVRNAIETYDRAAAFDPRRERDLLAAHRAMMSGLIVDAGRYRSGSVGVLQGSRVAHVAPPARQVPRLMTELLGFVSRERSLHPLIVSAIVHYELEFIHPFSDGNGRMGRLWQHVILIRRHPLFEHVPIESVIHDQQRNYYQVLAACDKAGDSTAFVDFSLATIQDALAAFMRDLRPGPATAGTRLTTAHALFAGRQFSRRDYLAVFKTLSTATASRDLKEGVSQGLLRKTGDRALARYRFTREPE